MKPNLFSIATKELSQDAFITWLLQWADPKCAAHNEKLHSAAESFAKELISLQSLPPEKISRAEAGRQWESIDIWAKINSSYLIIIEDKVGTGAHSNQLPRYRSIGERWCQENECTLVCVYLKTHSDSALNIEAVKSQGFAVLSRERFLEFLNSHQIENEIYIDFRDRLNELVESESGFSNKTIGDWNAGDWKGLYQCIEKQRSVVNWFYVNNPTGGFWNLVLNWLELDDICIYIQIEQGDLCFKVGEVYKTRSEIRDRLHGILMSAALPEMKLRRPVRFGNGKYMTVATIDRGTWLGRDDETIRIDEVISRLNQYEAWLVEIVERQASIEPKTPPTEDRD